MSSEIDSALAAEHAEAAAQAVKLKSFEDRMRMRDEHIDTKFKSMTDNISALDKRFTTKIDGVEAKIDHGLERVFQVITNAKESESKEREREKNQPATIRVQLLIGMAGIMFPTIVLAGSVIGLLVSPLREGQRSLTQGIKEIKASASAAKDDALVNKTRASERYTQQQAWNNDKTEWNRRIVDRQLEHQEEVRDVKAEMKTMAPIMLVKESNKEIRDDMAGLAKELSRIDAELSYVQLHQDREFPEFVEHTKKAAELQARVHHLEASLSELGPVIANHSNIVGRLAPLTDGMGLSEPVGNKERIELLEKLILGLEARASGAKGDAR